MMGSERQRAECLSLVFKEAGLQGLDQRGCSSEGVLSSRDTALLHVTPSASSGKQELAIFSLLTFFDMHRVI